MATPSPTTNAQQQNDSSEKNCSAVSFQCR